jgi:predicted dehydrogenase
MKIAVIGAGSMGKNHLRVVEQIPGLELTCVVDTDPQTLAEREETHHIPGYDHYKKIPENIDAVMVSTPTENHYEIARYFLKRGKHVLVEKPVTNLEEEAQELIDLAREGGLCLAVGHLERFNPAVLYADEVVKDPLFIEIQRLGPFTHRSIDVDVIMDLMIHDLDMILHWDQSPITDIRASGIPIISDKIDICNARIEFQSGMVANITASRVSQKKTRKLRIFQKNAYLSIDYKKKRVKEFQLKGGVISEKQPEIPDEEPLMNMWRNFQLTVSSGRNHNVTGIEGLNALTLARKISDRTQR